MLWLTVRKLKSNDVNVKRGAINKLGLSKNKKAITPLIDVFLNNYGFGDNFTDGTRSGIVNALNSIDPNWQNSDIGQHTLQQLLQQLKSTDISLRYSAVNGLIHLKDNSSVPILIEQLRDQSISVRRHVAEALAVFGDTRAIPALIIASMKDRGEYNSELKTINNDWAKIDNARTVVPELISVFDESTWQALLNWFRKNWEEYFTLNPNTFGSLEMTMSKAWKIRNAAAFYLGEIGDILAVESLIKALDDNDFPVRETAAYALGKIGDLRAVDPLLSAFGKSQLDKRSFQKPPDRDYDIDVKGAIVWALGNLKDKKCVDTLVSNFSNCGKSIFTVIAALAKIGDERGIEPIASWLASHPNTWVEDRINAIKALAQIGGAKGQAALNDEINRMNLKYNVAIREFDQDYKDLNAALQSALKSCNT